MLHKWLLHNLIEWKKNSERIIQLIKYDFSWASLTMWNIAEMFTLETSTYQGLLVILEQAVSLLSFRDLLVRLHLMICFFPFSIKTDNSVKKREKTLLVLINLARVIENEPIIAKGSGNDQWTSPLSLRLCLRWLLLSMRIGDLFWKREFCFHRDLYKT